MTAVLHALLIVFAFVCFIAASLPVETRTNFVALGLASWMLATVI
jgi:hypothetical protein